MSWRPKKGRKRRFYCHVCVRKTTQRWDGGGHAAWVCVHCGCCQCGR